MSSTRPRALVSRTGSRTRKSICSGAMATARTHLAHTDDSTRRTTGAIRSASAHRSRRCSGRTTRDSTFEARAPSSRRRLRAMARSRGVCSRSGEDDAEKHTNVSLWHALGGAGFIPNIRAQDASVFGVGARYLRSFGLDPKGLRTTLELRGEGGTGTFDYARASAEATATHGLGAKLDGALTASIGGSAGSVPVQRLWFLGGVATVRGQEPGTQAGDAYWLGRAELGRTFEGFRPTIFYDLGWAGARDALREIGATDFGRGCGCVGARWPDSIRRRARDQSQSCVARRPVHVGEVLAERREAGAAMMGRLVRGQLPRATRARTTFPLTVLRR